MTTKPLIALLSLFFAVNGYCQDSNRLTLADLTSKGATQLSKEDLQALLPGAKVISIASTGSTRFWENSADGRFIASSDNRAGKTGRQTSANGTWHLGDNATYCVLLEWKTATEQWCYFILKAGNKHYGVKSMANQASTAFEFSFSK